MSSVQPNATRRWLTVAVVLHDERDRLEETLASVRSIADEILLIETGPAGTSASIAESFRARVIASPWRQDYSAARNAALQAARGDWILWIEPGERLEAESAVELRLLVDETTTPRQAIFVWLELPSIEPYGMSERMAVLRLMPAHPRIKFAGRVCETAEESLVAEGISFELCHWQITRPVEDHNPAVKRRRAGRDSRLIQLELADRGPTHRILIALGEILATMGDAEKARSYFRQAMSTAARGSNEMLEAWYGLLTTFGDDAAGREQQIAECVKALEAFPFDAQLLCAMGGYLQAQGQAELACRSFRTALDYGQVHPRAWHLKDMSQFAAICLVIALQIVQRDEEARQVLDDALTRHIGSAMLRYLSMQLHIKQGKVAEALGEVDRLPADTPHREALRSAVRGACLAAKENWIAAIAYLDAAFAAGCRHAICLRWYALALQACARGDEARSVLTLWQQLEPRNVEPRQLLESLTAITAQPPAQSTASNTTLDKLNVKKPAAERTDIRRLRIDSASAPHDAAVHFRLGQAYHSQGDDATAESVWRDYLTRCPDSPQVLQALCELLIRGSRTSEALELFERTAHKSAWNEAFRDFMRGVSAANRQDWGQCAMALESARRRGYAETVLFEHLTVCLMRLGRFEEAQSLLGKLEASRQQRPQGTLVPHSPPAL